MNDLISAPQIQPLRPFSSTSSPIVTITTVSTGPCSNGRITTRSTRTPNTNANASVRKNVTQYGTPQSISCQAKKVVKVAISPCAKLITSVER